MSTIAICGDSGAGKSYFANILATKLGNASVLETDRYHKWPRNHVCWNQMTQLNPKGNNLDLMAQDIQTLKSGQSIWRPSYNHVTGEFSDPQEIKASRNLIVCGLHTLMCDDDLFDLTIFLETEHNLKLGWKIARDTKERGYTLSQVMQQILKRAGEYEKYIEPLRAKADVVIKRSATSREVIIQNQRIGVSYIIDELRIDKTL